MNPIAPRGPQTITSVSDATNSSDVGRAPSLLPPPASTDPHTMLAVLQLQSLSQASEASEKSREAYEVAEDASDRARIETMREKATETLVLGVTSGLTTMAEGTFGMIGATKNTSTKEGEQSRDLWKGIATIAQGAGKTLETIKGVNATNKDAHIAEFERVAKEQKRAAERIGREIERSGQSEAKVRELLAEILKAKDACERAALLRFA